MRGNQVEERRVQSVTKKHVAGFGGMFGFKLRTGAADLLQRARETLRVASELHGGSVGEKFALPADGGLNEVAEEHADPTDYDEREAKQRQRILASARAQQDAPDDSERQNPEDDAHEPQVESHVAVENVAEFVTDDALQFFAR